VDIDIIIKTRNKKLFSYFVSVLCILFLAENFNFELQTNRKLKKLTL